MNIEGYQRIVREYNNLMRFDHPYIIRPIVLIEYNEGTAILLPYLGTMTLREFLLARLPNSDMSKNCLMF